MKAKRICQTMFFLLTATLVSVIISFSAESSAAFAQTKEFVQAEVIITCSKPTVTYGEEIKLVADFSPVAGAEAVLPGEETATTTYLWQKHIGVDYVDLSFNTQEIILKNVADSGTYRVTVTKTTPDIIKSGAAITTITINPQTITATWQDQTTFIFNEQPQAPTATAVIGENTIELEISGYGTDAKILPYCATAIYADTNYKIINPTKEFTISPQPIAVTWGELTLPYNGKNQHPTATAINANGNSIPLFYSTCSKDLIADAPISVSPISNNYILTGNTAVFDIVTNIITKINWYAPSAIVYNGSNQLDKITATFADGAGGEQKLDIILADDKEFINADKYRAIATLPQIYSPNYSFAEDLQLYKALVINKAKPTISVSEVYQKFVYDGNPHSFSATLSNGGEIVYMLNGAAVNNSFTDAGIYSLVLKSATTANYQSADSQNVTLTILRTTLQSYGNIKCTINSSNGIDPTAELVLTYETATKAKQFRIPWGEKLIAIYGLTLTSDNSFVTTTGKTHLKLAVPKEMADAKEVKILLYKNNVTEQKTLVVQDGFIEFDSEGLYDIAFVTNNPATNIIFWCVASGTVVATILIAVAVAIHKKRKLG